MNEERKLFVDLLKGVTLGAFAAVVFRDAGLIEGVSFTILGAAALVSAVLLIRRSP